MFATEVETKLFVRFIDGEFYPVALTLSPAKTAYLGLYLRIDDIVVFEFPNRTIQLVVSPDTEFTDEPKFAEQSRHRRA